MKVLKYLFLIAILFQCGAASAQTLKGKVYSYSNSGKKEPLYMATVVWAGTNIGVSADADGNFSIKKTNKESAKLVASFIGYVNDTLDVPQNAEAVEFVLYENVQALAGATVVHRQKGSFVAKMLPMKTDVITAAGLCKMACCNLAESFENSASISVGYSDAVSGARQIRMLGLSGIYTQMLDENIPAMRGVASTYAMSFTPGQWLESIQVSKGTSSVINGYEAITGQIDLEHRKPNRSEPLNLNLYGDLDQRFEINASSAVKINEKLSTIVFAHGSADTKYHDMNDDDFADYPKTNQINFGNRWLYNAGDGKVQIRFGYSYLQEKRKGGQRTNHSLANPYLSTIDNQHFRAYTKIGMPFNEDGSRSLAFVASYSFHEQNSMFGKKTYDGLQNSLFTNLLWQSTFDKESKHRYTVGASFTHDNYNEKYNDAQFANLWNGDRTESVAGLFGEYTFKPNEKFDLIAGIRADRNNLYKTTFVTPRAHVRYNFAKNSTIRVSVGRGFRSPNAIADNIGMLATGREIVIDKNLKAEKAWTYGLSLTQDFKLNEKQGGYISFDYFRTSFQNQTIVDVEASNQYITIGNLDGKSYSNCYQVDFSIDPIERFNVFATFRYNQTKVDMSRGLVEKPLVDRYKALINLAYSTKFEKWRFDFTAQLNGGSRIPYYAAQTIGRKNSKAYPLFFAQITKRYKNIDIYAGCENIFDYTQDNPIINAENPFDTKFDASVVYAPLMGRKIYLGIRLKLGKAD